MNWCVKASTRYRKSSTNIPDLPENFSFQFPIICLTLLRRITESVGEHLGGVVGLLGSCYKRGEAGGATRRLVENAVIMPWKLC